MEFYRKSANEVIENLGSSMQGLSEKESQTRISTYGLNELQGKKHSRLFSIIIDQFKDFLVMLLIVAAIISLILGHLIEVIVISIMIILTVVLGFFQEYKAEKSLEKLKKRTSRQAVVIRDGSEEKIDATKLVPGDIIVLESGSIVPADIRLVESYSLKVDESSLIGESQYSYKNINLIKKQGDISTQKNMVFMGSVVVYGKGLGIVVKTGMSTEFGKIAHSLSEVKDEQTPMKKKLAKIGKQLVTAITVICIIVFINILIKGNLTWNETFIVALSLAIAAAPTSLPAIVTIALSKAVVELSKKNMLIKKLPAAEALGSVTIICADKTGTLTRNEMSVTKLFCNNKLFDVNGVGYSSDGKILFNNKQVNKKELSKLLEIGVICNDSGLIFKKDKCEIIGDPTEVALLVLGNKANLSRKDALDTYRVLQELPFDSDRKMMSVVCKDEHNKIESLTKGAASTILERCNKILINNKVVVLTSVKKRKIMQAVKKMESSALRVIAFSYKALKPKHEYSMNDVEKNMVFVGIVGMIDPPRRTVKDSIVLCRKAGINVMMITGDSPITAEAIGKEIGLLQKNDVIITGMQLDRMSDAELEKKITRIRICARFLPIQKLRIVSALQKYNHIVAMTGDGVNDAPALKKANLGIAMGITGTDVAKEVSEMTLADDNFSSIVSAIDEGRNIYDSILKSIKYLLICNAGEILTIFIALMLNFPVPLLPLQILLMKLLTDGLPALALSAEPNDPTIMNRSPRDPNERPITSGILWLVLVFGGIMSGGTIFLFNYFYQSTSNLALARTIAFTSLVMFEMFAVLSSRALYKPAISKDFFNNKFLHFAILSSILVHIAVVYIPFLQGIFGTVALSLTHWMYIVGVAFIGFIVMEISKLFIKYEKPKS